jgi:uncharacterized protein YdhG (YjbR/CyaY superfamily)
MKSREIEPENIDAYISGFPEDTREILETIRLTIKKAAPRAMETISYKMPTFTLNGDHLVYFAAYKKHIGFYPVPMGKTEFKKELSAYESGKGTAKFPLDKPIPLGLIRKIVKFRVKENLAKAAAKKRKIYSGATK